MTKIHLILYSLFSQTEFFIIKLCPKFLAQVESQQFNYLSLLTADGLTRDDLKLPTTRAPLKPQTQNCSKMSTHTYLTSLNMRIG